MSSTPAATPGISPDEALAVVHDDAVAAYGELSRYQIVAVLEPDGWHVDYELRDPDRKGGGAHSAIDAVTGDIRAKRYEQ